jgi:hypothetical protein
MFGNGVYMYRNDKNGKFYAREWAKYKILKENFAGGSDCILLIDFNYDNNEHITWTDEEEYKFNKWLKEKRNIAQFGSLTRSIQNRYRMIFVSAAAERMNTQYKIIFANMPLSKNISGHGKKRYSACAVKDLCILPGPPYLQE